KRIAFADATNSLVCAADPSAIAEAAADGAVGGGGGGAGGGGATSGGQGQGISAAIGGGGLPKMPADVDGVLLENGRQIEGTYERVKRKLTIHPKDGGDALTVDVADVVVAQQKGETDIRGDDWPAFRTWKRAVGGVYCDAMEVAFHEYAKASLVDDARRVLQRMRDNGASETCLQGLD